MKATTLLEKQHRRVEAAFKKLTSGKEDVAPVLQQLADELTAHMVIEEQIFYPAVRALDEAMVFESFEEHAIASFALARLLECDATDLRFLARVTALKELIEHHVKEEETELFPKVDKKLAEEANQALGARMKVAFDEQVGLGHAAVLPRRAPRSTTDKAAAKEAERAEDEPTTERRRIAAKTKKKAALSRLFRGSSPFVR